MNFGKLRIAVAFGVLAAICGLTALPANAGVLADIKARNKLICGTQGTSPRYSFENPLTRKLEGYEVDLCTDLAKSLGVPVEFKIVSSQDRIPELMQGRVDVLAALITYSADRAKQLDFSNAYFVEPFNVAVHPDAGIKTFADIAAKPSLRMGDTKGSLLTSIVTAKFPHASLISFNDPDQEFLAFQQGKVDTMNGRRGNLRGYQKKIGEDKMTILPGALLEAAVGFPVQKGNPDFVAAINKFLTDEEASGQGATLYTKYFGDMGITRSFQLGDRVDR